MWMHQNGNGSLHLENLQWCECEYFSDVLVTSDGLMFYTYHSVYRGVTWPTDAWRPFHELSDQCSSKYFFLILCWQRSILWGHWLPQFWTSHDPWNISWQSQWNITDKLNNYVQNENVLVISCDIIILMS